MLPVARLFRAPIWCPSGGGGTREAGSTIIAKSLVALYREGTHQIRRGRRAARSPTSQGSAEPLRVRAKGAKRRFLGGKLNSDLSARVDTARRTGKIRGDFSGMHRALDGWILARAPASPARGLHHYHGPRYVKFPYSCMMCGLGKLGPVDQN